MREGHRPVVKGPSAVTGIGEGTLFTCFEGCRAAGARVLLEARRARSEHETDEIKRISKKLWANLERYGIHNLLPLSTCASMHQPAGNQCLSNLYTELCAVTTLRETDNNSAISIFDFFKRDAHRLQKKADQPSQPRHFLPIQAEHAAKCASCKETIGMRSLRQPAGT